MYSTCFQTEGSS